MTYDPRTYAAHDEVTSTDMNRIETGIAAAVLGTDARLADTRTPTDASVTDAKVASGAAIAEAKLSLASDAAAGTASRRTLGTAATQAAAGNHTHLSAAVTDLTESVQDLVAAFVVAGTGMTVTYDDTGNTLTFASTGVGATDTVSVIATGGTAQTLPDPATNAGTRLTLTSATCTLTFPTAPSSPSSKSFTLHVHQDATGGRAIAWPASSILKWGGGLAPALTTTASAYDVFTFVSDNGIWVGFPAAKAVA